MECNYLPTCVIASCRKRRSNLKFHKSNKNIRETREGDCFGGAWASLGVSLLPPRNDSR